MIDRDPIVKGCTRPAMLLGVPITPLVVTFGGVALLAVWINLFLLLLFLPIYAVMRIVVKNDDQQFHLLGLKAQCRLIGTNRDRNYKFWGASAYSPIKFEKRKLRK